LRLAPASGISAITELWPAELAKMVGSDEAEIESWETGSSVIYLKELVVLCKALNVSPNILLGRHDAK
jgi:hypothetical protein